MEPAMSATLNIIKDTYLAAIDWIEIHPHLTFWAGVGSLIAALVFG